MQNTKQRQLKADETPTDNRHKHHMKHKAFVIQTFFCFSDQSMKHQSADTSTTADKPMPGIRPSTHLQSLLRKLQAPVESLLTSDRFALYPQASLTAGKLYKHTAFFPPVLHKASIRHQAKHKGRNKVTPLPQFKRMKFPYSLRHLPPCVLFHYELCQGLPSNAFVYHDTTQAPLTRRSCRTVTQKASNQLLSGL